MVCCYVVAAAEINLSPEQTNHAVGSARSEQALNDE